MAEARTVLWYLVFIGFAVNYMIRINLNITIVEMIVTKPLASNNTKSQLDMPIVVPDRSESINGTNNYISNIKEDNKMLSNREKYSLEKDFFRWRNIKYDEDGFKWDEYQQGLILGSFFWAHWATQIPGGILAKKYGTKLVFGLSNAVGCWLCFFIPVVSYYDYRILIWLRIVQGLITGLSWPAMHVLTAKWIPPNERSKFVTSYLGSSVGIGVFYPLFGYVMHWTSWEWVYHICGVFGTIWWFGWLVLVFDSPMEHPRIKLSELRYIEKSLGASVQNEKNLFTPWREILTSRPVWMNVIAQWGGIWGLFTLMTQAPTYFSVIHQWNIRATGLLSGLPHFMRMIFAYIFSIFADFILRTEKLGRTNLRKLATAVCCILNGLIVLALAYYGHNEKAAIIFFTASTMVHGAVSSGPLASIVDISPNYAGIVLGISGMIGVLPGFISPYIVGLLTLNNQTYEAWKNIFMICSGMLIGSGILYVLFADSTLQFWNSSIVSDDIQREMKLLHSTSENNVRVSSSQQDNLKCESKEMLQ